MGKSRQTIGKLVEFFAPQLAYLKKTARKRSKSTGQFVSVNEIIRSLVQAEMNKHDNR